MRSTSRKAKPWLWEKGRRHGRIKEALQIHKALPSSAFSIKGFPNQMPYGTQLFYSTSSLGKMLIFIYFLKVFPVL